MSIATSPASKRMTAVEFMAIPVVVWEIDPDFQTVRVHQPGELVASYNVAQELVADAYLPDFQVAVASIFED
jgi:Uma2 family endonuclease